MKLSKLKQVLLENNNTSVQRKVSCIREEFRIKQDIRGLKEPTLKDEMKIDSEITNQGFRDVTSYNQNRELSRIVETTGVQQELDQFNISNNNENKVDSVKIIGITGSRGKSTTAFLVHNFLEKSGFKSILYSSIQIKSPASYINEEEACEIPLQDENTLINIIEEAEAYDADYVVLEVNESTIEKGLVKGIPFTVRALTNIDIHHNDEQYSTDEYVKLKKSFFENIPEDENCTCVLGLTGGFTRDEFNGLLHMNNHPKITYGTKYLCELKNADYSNLDCMMYNMKSSIDGLDLKIRLKEKSYDFKTNIILPHNSLNIICAISILEALNIFNPEVFNNSISNISIPGREEIIKVNNRTIVIGLSLMPALENFKAFRKNSNGINKIKVITAGVGTGFVSWDKALSTDNYLSKRSSVRRFCMNYVKENSDYAIITSNDNAAENPLSIAQEMQGYLNAEIPSVIVVDREEAIRKVIAESEPYDLIYISGRGNRRIFCDSVNTVKLIKDKEVAEKVLKELGW